MRLIEPDGRDSLLFYAILGFMFGAVAAVQLLICSGCGATPLPPPRVVPSAPLPLVTYAAEPIPFPGAMERAKRYWNCILGFEAFWPRGRVSDNDHTIILERIPPSKERSASERITLALARQHPPRIRWGERLLDYPKRAVEQIYRHELGHILGLEHTEIKSGDVMQPTYTPDAKPLPVSEDDAGALYQTYGLGDLASDLSACNNVTSSYVLCGETTCD